ncbi:MAG: sulfotransferase [Anaerolineales bacterium]|nr:sulfotransferase [Anaerolineales bacterium]
MKQSLRLPEKELTGVIHGYSLANCPFLHLLGHFYQIHERLVLGPRLDRIPIDRPVFIVGPYRSGTTILQEIITAHPQVGYFWYLTNVFGQSNVLSYRTTRLFFTIGLIDSTPISPVHNPSIPAHILSPFECESVWRPTRRSLWDDRDMLLDAGFSDPAFERRLLRLIRNHLYAAKASRFLNKNPINSLRLAYLHKLFPEACFINIVRAPLPTIFSHYRTAARVENAFNQDAHTRYIFRKQLYIDMLSHRIRTAQYPEIQTLNRQHPLLGIASQWTAMQQAIMGAAAANPDIPLLNIRYEELVRDPERTLERMWTFTDLDDEQAAKITRTYRQRLAPRPSVMLTDEEKQYLPQIMDIVAPTAGQLGYEIRP